MTDIENYGSGVSLDENYDFIIDSTGDLEDSRGLSELEKDLSFASSVRLFEHIGMPLTSTRKQKIKNSVESIMSSEPRISSVLNISVSQSDYGFDIRSDVVADSERMELYFPVGDKQ